MQKILRRLLAVILTICILSSFSASVSAASSDGKYSYWYDVSSANKSVYSKAMYNATELIGASDLGVDDFTEITNIAADEKYIYILDSASRIVILDKNYKLIREIGLINGTESYENAKSIYVYKDGTIYICDTSSHRILHITSKGKLIETITLPDSQLIPDDFNFLPTHIVRDDYGYLYVLSDGSYYGALLYDPNGDFVGFYGANTVAASFSGVLTNIKNRLFPNNEKLSKTTQKLPFCFVDLDIDKEGFVYTCNGFTSNSDRKGKIRKLSPGVGSDILGSSNVVFTDYDTPTYTIQGQNFERHNIIDIAVDSNGFIYSLELTYGKIFVYDNDCRILNVFGGGMGEGTQLGSFVTVSGMSLIDNGEKILVSDSQTNKITVFEITDYGREVKRLISLTADGDYKQAKSGWIKILSEDKNFQPAYSGLAKAYLSEKDYESAIECAELGYDRETYAIAFEILRKDFIDDNFLWIFGVAILIIVGFIALIVISNKKKLVFIKNKNLSFMLSTSIHPSNNFTDVKEKKMGSVPLCILLVAVFYVVTVLQTLAGGFMFTVYDPASFNSIWVFVRTVGLVILWVVANWMVCTLLGGKGKLREIIVVTCYSLLPIIVEKIIRLVLTNILLPTEAAFLGILDTVAILYFGLMMIIGLIKIHDFSFGRFVGTTVLSVAGIAAIVFLIIMIVILVQQFWGFIVTVGSEILTL